MCVSCVLFGDVRVIACLVVVVVPSVCMSMSDVHIVLCVMLVVLHAVCFICCRDVCCSVCMCCVVDLCCTWYAVCVVADDADDCGPGCAGDAAD